MDWSPRGPASASASTYPRGCPGQSHRELAPSRDCQSPGTILSWDCMSTPGWRGLADRDSGSGLCCRVAARGAVLPSLTHRPFPCLLWLPQRELSVR